MNTPTGREMPGASDSSSGVRDPVELLAGEFLERRRRGERPTIEGYAAQHPELADAIRDLFPALLMMENMGEGSLDVPAPEGDRSGATVGASKPEDPEGPAPERLGDYRVLREIGRGAMGVVYEAEQGSLSRRVALKILPARALSNPTQVRRFEREARAAGRLHHTNIVPVFGVGIEGDTHYYVMQYIQGQPLSEVIAELRRLRREAVAGPPAAVAEGKAPVPTAADVARSLWQGDFEPAEASTTDDRPATVAETDAGPAVEPRSAHGAPASDSGSNPLIRSSAPAHSNWRYARTVAGLGAQVAEALDHAAQQGVLHRDVKPSNLLLDVHGTLWVTDFGLAKLDDHDDLTRTGDILGTLRYMAPERFRGQADVRSDIYGLGLTLYELLALRPAYEETDRARLIDRLTRADPEHLLKLDSAIPRDLATVVHKAIARDPSDRYQTAGDLASDLTRFLEDRPIRARRLGPLGVSWRWARRNKAVASLLGLVAALLIGITAVSTTAAERYRNMATRADEARMVADAAKKQAEARRQESEASAARALAARAEADQSAAEANAVLDFMVNGVLGSASPSRSKGESLTVLQALERADKMVEGRFTEQPRVEAAVRMALASVYSELAEYEKSEGHAARALALREAIFGPEHEATLDAMQTLGWSYYQQGKHDKQARGETLYRKMLEICRRTRGDEDDLTLTAMNGLAAILGRLNRPVEAVELQEKILEVRRKQRGPSDPEPLNAINNLAAAFISIGRLKEAEPLLRELVEADLVEKRDDPGSLTRIRNYVSILSTLKRIDEASLWAERSRDAHLRVLKFKHPATQQAIVQAILMRTDDPEDEVKLRLIDEALDQARREFGPDDPNTLTYLNYRVELLYEKGDLAGAASGAKERLEALTRNPDTEESTALDALSALATIRRDQGDTADAKALIDRLREAAARALDPERKPPPGPSEALEIRRQAAFGEVFARNLDRAGRADVAPGEPGGPPRIDAPYQDVSPVADGRIEPGEYGDGDGFAYDFSDDHNPGLTYIFDETTRATKEPSDLSVRFHAAHTETALFLAFRVRDQFVRADPVAAKVPHLNDSVEVLLDGDRVPNDLNRITFDGNCEGFQLIADSLGDQYSAASQLSHALGSGTDSVGEFSWRAAASRAEDGYIIEFEVPLDLIDTRDGPEFRPAATGSELLMNLAINDIDEEVNNQTSFGMIWSESRLWSPLRGGEDFWPVALRLTPAPASGR